MPSLNTSLSKGKYEGTLAEISTLEIDKDATYVILDFPIGGITNEQMVSALTESKKKFYQIGSVYTCTDSGTYTQGHSYKFIGTTWVDITPMPDLTNYVTTNTAQTITGTKTISDTSLDIEKTNIAGNAKWHLEEDQYAQLAISRTYNGTKQRMLQFNGGSIVPEGSTNNLGSANKLWKNIYVLGNLTDGTNSIPVANITPQSMINDAYDNTLTYSVGDVVIYNNTLYKCTTAVTAAEDFDITKWTAITLVTYIQSSSGSGSTTYRHDISIEGTTYKAYFTYYSASNTQLTANTLQAFMGGSFHEKTISVTGTYYENNTYYSVYAISNGDYGPGNDAVVLLSGGGSYVVLVDAGAVIGSFTLTDDVTSI